MKKKLITAIALAMAAMMSLAACATTGGDGGSTTTTPGDGDGAVADGGETGTGSEEGGGTASSAAQTLSFAVLNDPDSLDPGFTANTFAGPVFFTAFEGLVTYDTENNLVPGVAESWDISEDGLVYTFHLRDGLKWSDGSDFTAADFEYSWKRILDPAFASSTANLVYPYIKNAKAAYDGEMDMDEVGVEALDETTLQVTLETPTSFFLQLASTWTYMPVKREAVEGSDDWTGDPSTYISNGPFKLEQYRLSDTISLVKNDHYHGSAGVSLERIDFKIITELTTALSGYETGSLDGMIRVPAAEAPRLKTREDYYSMPQFGNTYYLVNTTSGPLQDARVRQALSMALDRTALIEDVLQTTYEPAVTHVPPGYVVDGVDFRQGGGDYGLSGSPNIDGALDLLREAGYEDLSQFPTLRLGYYTNDTQKKVAEAMQQMWKQNLGIEMEIVSAEWTVFYQQVLDLDYDICAMGDLGTYLHPMAFLGTFVGDEPPLETGWRSAEYDALVQSVIEETDPARALELMHEAEDLFMNDHPIIPLYHGSQEMMMAEYVKNWHYSPTGVFVFRDIVIEDHD